MADFVSDNQDRRQMAYLVPGNSHNWDGQLSKIIFGIKVENLAGYGFRLKSLTSGDGKRTQTAVKKYQRRLFSFGVFGVRVDKLLNRLITGPGEFIGGSKIVNKADLLTLDELASKVIPDSMLGENQGFCVSTTA